MSQIVMQNMRTDRQVKYDPKTISHFQQNIETPLSVGVPLMLHSRVRETRLISNLSNIYIGNIYYKVMNRESRIHQAVLQRMISTGG